MKCVLNHIYEKGLLPGDNITKYPPPQGNTSQNPPSACEYPPKLPPTTPPVTIGFLLKFMIKKNTCTMPYSIEFRRQKSYNGNGKLENSFRVEGYK